MTEEEYATLNKIQGAGYRWWKSKSMRGSGQAAKEENS